MAGVTPRQVYQALIDAGASTIQAIGIMANGLAESGLDPEAIGDGGTSFGTWQQHGAGYAGLVTGNPQADLKAQVRVVAQNGGFAAASGSNAGEAAGNFSARYERCTTCQPGQSSYNQRVANAATVAGWVSSGKWPTSAGHATSAGSGTGGGTGGTATSSSDPSCAWGFTLGGGGVGPLHLPQADICFIKKATLRHAAGIGLMAAGGSVGMVGVILLAAFAFRASGAARAAGQIAATFTPAGRVYERSVAAPRRAQQAAAGTAARQQGRERAAAQRAAQRREERAAAEVRQPRNLRPIRQAPPNYRPPADQGAEPAEFHHEGGGR